MHHHRDGRDGEIGPGTSLVRGGDNCEGQPPLTLAIVLPRGGQQMVISLERKCVSLPGVSRQFSRDGGRGVRSNQVECASCRCICGTNFT